MESEFTISIDQVTYQFKRIFHPDIPLSYHIHFNDWHQHTVFRMRQNDSGRWLIVPMHLPAYVLLGEERFIKAIEDNEKA